MGLLCDGCRNSYDTRTVQGDLMLCNPCAAKTFPHTYASKKQPASEAISPPMQPTATPDQLCNEVFEVSGDNQAGATASGASNMNSERTKSVSKTNAASKPPKMPSLCIPGCKHKKGKSGGDMIRCCLCARWFHGKCLELSADDMGGVWACFSCRRLGGDLQHTNTKLAPSLTTLSAFSRYLERPCMSRKRGGIGQLMNAQSSELRLRNSGNKMLSYHNRIANCCTRK